MKWIVIGILLTGVRICAGCTSSSPGAEVTNPGTLVDSGMPNLVGNWSGTCVGYIETAGYQVFQDSMTLIIV
jgi:hypothetical protein